MGGGVCVGVSAQGAVSARGVSAWELSAWAGGVYGTGVSAQCMLGYMPPLPVNRMADACEKSYPCRNYIADRKD